MSKKDYIIKLMDSLSWKRALARWLKILVEWDLLGENTIDSLVQTFDNAIKEINDVDIKDKLIKSQQFLERLRNMEIQSNQSDQKDIDELDLLLQNI